LLRYLARRLATAAITLLVVTLVVFLLVQLAPGEPLGADVGEERPGRLSPEARAILHAQYRLDRPILVQYALWLGDLVRGDLGRSILDRRPVSEAIARALGPTLAINTLSLALMVACSVPLGALAALRPGSAWDRGGAVGTYVLYALPVFWVALLLQSLFAAGLGWLPLAGVRSPGFEYLAPIERIVDRAAHLVLPVVCLSYGGLAYLSRFVRASLLEAEAEGWRAVRARGASRLTVLYRHGFRQAGVPMLTLAGFLVPGLVGGSVLVETIFAVPGLGRLFVTAVFRRDVPVVMGLTLLSAVATIGGILLADLLYAAIDPRIRRARAS
jgi:peptide/nickel transport system permease protein